MRQTWPPTQGRRPQGPPEAPQLMLYSTNHGRGQHRVRTDRQTTRKTAGGRVCLSACRAALPPGLCRGEHSLNPGPYSPPEGPSPSTRSRCIHGGAAATAPSSCSIPTVFPNVQVSAPSPAAGKRGAGTSPRPHRSQDTEQQRKRTRDPGGGRGASD